MATTILPLHFSLLTLLSVWCPVHWSSRRKFAYKLYSLTIMLALVSLNGFQVARLLLVRAESFVEFNQSFAFVVSMEACIAKGLSHLLNRDKVIHLIGMFEADYCAARDDFERKLRRVYDEKCASFVKKTFFVYEILVLSFLTAPLGLDAELRVLPYPVLLPYSLASPLNYWLSYAHQVIGTYYVGHIGIASDLVAASFMWQLCGQLELLKHRLQKLPVRALESGAPSVQRQLLGECVRHHVHLYDIADAITAAFSVYIVFQFYVDVLEIVMSVYQLSIMTVIGVSDILTYIIYIGMMLGRVFINCYFGNEVAVQSKNLSDVIFHIDWTPLSLEMKQNLFTMILRSPRPIMISNRAFVRLMLESFIKVVKVSYSGYNLLTTSM